MSEQTFGRYHLRGLIGKGGMATVYLAIDPRFEREVAIKVLPRHFLHDDSFQTRFQQEAKTIAALEHPAIVPVHDFGEENGQPYLVMRYMVGGTLTGRLQSGLLLFETARDIAVRLAAALQEAHQRGIIHRDLKPDNILFDQFGNPYLSDFGIAKLAAQTQTFTQGIIGTPQYMSPEQWRAKEALDGRCDQYALGIILYQMLTGDLPFYAQATTGYMLAHINEPVPDIAQKMPISPPGIGPFIQKTLAKDRKNRFESMAAWAAALQNVGHSPKDGRAPNSDRFNDPTAEMPALKTIADVDTVGADPNQDPRLATAGRSPLSAVPWWGWLVGGLLVALVAFGVITWGSPNGEPDPLALVETTATENTPEQVAAPPTLADQEQQEPPASESDIQVEPTDAPLPVPATAAVVERDLNCGEMALGQVTIFRDGQCQGEQQALQPGFYNLTTLGFNDAVSAVYIPPGSCAVVYEHNDRDGQSVTMTQHYWDLSLDQWLDGTGLNDAISSIDVYEAAPCPPEGENVEAFVPPDALGIEWIEIPAGSFMMGAAPDDIWAAAAERPLHEVELPTFWISRREISNAQYLAFVEATGHPVPYRSRDDFPWLDDETFAETVEPYLDESNWNPKTETFPSGKGDHPVTVVSWADAQAFADWLSDETGYVVLLPSEAEWEKAARGNGDPLIYPWGDEFEGGRLNYCDTNCRELIRDEAVNDGYVVTAPVDFYPSGISPYGVEGMAGNVQEWTRSAFTDRYPYSASNEVTNPESPAVRVVRGGSWLHDFTGVRISARLGVEPTVRDGATGFRVVVHAP